MRHQHLSILNDLQRMVMLVIEKRSPRLRLGLSLVCLTLIAVWAGSARADWIVGFPPEPGGTESPTNLDMTHWLLTVSYDGAGNFTVSSQYPGVGVLNNFSDPIYDIGTNTTLNIAMSINPTTGAPISGSVVITGDATPYYSASPSGTLLTGSISQFGFADPGDTTSGAEHFQFIFDTTGGDLAAWYPSIAINLDYVNINFSGTFGNIAFVDDSGNAFSDSFSGPPMAPVPEPASISLLCFGALAVTGGLGILRGAKVLRGNPMK